MTEALPENIDAITELDIAAFLEGCLSESHAAHVRSYLSAHPEIAEALDWEPEVSEEEIQPERRLIPAGPYFRWTRWLPVTAALAVLAAGAAWTHSAAAIERTLREGERVLSQRDLGDSDQFRMMETAEELQRLEGTMFLSEAANRRRATLLAQLYVEMAKLEVNRRNLTGRTGDSARHPAVRLAERSLTTLRTAGVPLHASVKTQIDAVRVLSVVHYLQATVDRKATGPERAKMMWLCATSILNLLEALDAENMVNAAKVRLELGGQLARSLHKGALGGEQTLAQTGVTTVGDLERRIRQLYQLPPNQLSDDLNDRRIEIVRLLSEKILEDYNQIKGGEIARLHVASAAGLSYLFTRAPHHDYDRAILLLERHLSTVPAHPSDALSVEEMIIIGVGYGNLGDAYRRAGRFDDARNIRPIAIRFLRAALHREYSLHALYELGWVTCRQLLSEYGAGQGTTPAVHELAGAVRQISGDLESLSGYDLNPQEILVIRLIAADSAALPRPEIPPGFFSEFVEVLRKIDDIPPVYPRLFRALNKTSLIAGNPDLAAAIQACDEWEARRKKPDNVVNQPDTENRQQEGSEQK